MQICWLIKGTEGYGTRRALISLLKGLEYRGEKVAILALEPGGFFQECARLGFVVRDLGYGQPPGFAGFGLETAKAFLELKAYERRVVSNLVGVLRSIKARVLHVNWSQHIALGGKATYELGIPCLWQMHGVISSTYPFGINKKLFQRQCQKYGVYPIGNSVATADSLKTKNVEPDILYLGVDHKRFDPNTVESKTRKELGIPTSAIVLGVFARMIPSKGQEKILRAMLTLLQNDRKLPLHLMLVGGPIDSNYANHLRKIAYENGFGNRLHLLGQISDPERYYGVVDIVLSVYKGIEAFGLSIVEAMMMKKPVIIHALGGPAEIVLDNETGWHVYSTSTNALADGILKALNNHGKWKDMGEKGRARAIEKYSVESYVNGYIELVSKLV